MSWKTSDIESLLRASDFSKKSDLKKKLLREIIPRSRISFDELESRYAKPKSRFSEKQLEEFKLTRQKERENEKARDDVLNNDKPILPGG